MTDPQNRIPRRWASRSALVAASLFLPVLTGMAGTWTRWSVPTLSTNVIDSTQRSPANANVNQLFLDSDAMLLQDGRVLVTLKYQPTLE